MENIVEEEVNQQEGARDNLDDQELPLPPANDLVQVMANQTRLLEALARGINCPRQREYGLQEKMSDFLRTKPPTFGGSVNPLDADDWLRVIQRKFEAIGCVGRDKVLLAAHQLTKTIVQRQMIPLPLLGKNSWKNSIITISQQQP